MKKDIERLVKEWIEHGKIVLAVDYDDTLFHWKYNSKEDCDKVMELVKWCKTIGAYIMIHTASNESRYSEITEYCISKGLFIDSINQNPIELPYGNEGKPYYNWQLCDRSGLDYAYTVLEGAAKQVLSIKNKNKGETLTEVG